MSIFAATSSGDAGAAADQHHGNWNNPYNYVPIRGVAIAFVVLYAISTILHTGQAVRYRLWWLLPTASAAGLIEIIGWSGRLWSTYNINNPQPFQMQIVGTIIAPTPLVAANFVILGHMIRYLGPQYSRLTPRLYAIIFCTCDVVSLVVQAIGGGMASSAAGSGRDPTPGGNVMLGGIAFQLATISIYMFCAAEFAIRYMTNRPIPGRVPAALDSEKHTTPAPRGTLTRNLRIMSAALVFSTICLFIRAVYRTIELADGWSGRIISTQVYFNVLDGAMVVLAIYTVNIIHPGIFLHHAAAEPVPQRESQDDEKTLK